MVRSGTNCILFSGQENVRKGAGTERVYPQQTRCGKSLEFGGER